MANSSAELSQSEMIDLTPKGREKILKKPRLLLEKMAKAGGVPMKDLYVMYNGKFLGTDEHKDGGLGRFVDIVDINDLSDSKLRTIMNSLSNSSDNSVPAEDISIHTAIKNDTYRLLVIAADDELEKGGQILFASHRHNEKYKGITAINNLPILCPEVEREDESKINFDAKTWADYFKILKYASKALFLVKPVIGAVAVASLDFAEHASKTVSSLPSVNKRIAPILEPLKSVFSRMFPIAQRDYEKDSLDSSVVSGAKFLSELATKSDQHLDLDEPVAIPGPYGNYTVVKTQDTIFVHKKGTERKEDSSSPMIIQKGKTGKYDKVVSYGDFTLGDAKRWDKATLFWKEQVNRSRDLGARHYNPPIGLPQGWQVTDSVADDAIPRTRRWAMKRRQKELMRQIPKFLKVAKQAGHGTWTRDALRGFYSQGDSYIVGTSVNPKNGADRYYLTKADGSAERPFIFEIKGDHPPTILPNKKGTQMEGWDFSPQEMRQWQALGDMTKEELPSLNHAEKSALLAEPEMFEEQQQPQRQDAIAKNVQAFAKNAQQAGYGGDWSSVHGGFYGVPYKDTEYSFSVLNDPMTKEQRFVLSDLKRAPDEEDIITFKVKENGHVVIEQSAVSYAQMKDWEELGSMTVAELQLLAPPSQSAREPSKVASSGAMTQPEKLSERREVIMKALPKFLDKVEKARYGQLLEDGELNVKIPGYNVGYIRNRFNRTKQFYVEKLPENTAAFNQPNHSSQERLIFKIKGDGQPEEYKPGWQFTVDEAERWQNIELLEPNDLDVPVYLSKGRDPYSSQAFKMPVNVGGTEPESVDKRICEAVRVYADAVKKADVGHIEKNVQKFELGNYQLTLVANSFQLKKLNAKKEIIGSLIGQTDGRRTKLISTTGLTMKDARAIVQMQKVDLVRIGKGKRPIQMQY